MTYLVYLMAPLVLTLCVVLAFVTDPGVRWRIRLRKPAERRAVNLLRSWLTPEQADEWEACHQFEVIGCDTGQRYRITRGTRMNIHQLDRSGKTVTEWCLAPEGKLAVGDVLLAQKIALETMERRALELGNSQSCRT
jgi:hypothetical protein